MPLEIIHRKDGELSQKQEIRHQYTQFSINSWGHLCIREFDVFNGAEHLVVLDQATTNGLIKFIFENRSTYEFKQLLQELIKKNNETPF